MRIKSHRERSELFSGPTAALVLSFIFLMWLDLGEEKVLQFLVHGRLAPADRELNR